MVVPVLLGATAATGVVMIAAPVLVGTTALGLLGFGAAGPVAGKLFR
jgi:hypothetical protein